MRDYLILILMLVYHYLFNYKLDSIISTNAFDLSPSILGIKRPKNSNPIKIVAKIEIPVRTIKNNTETNQPVLNFFRIRYISR